MIERERDEWNKREEAELLRIEMMYGKADRERYQDSLANAYLDAAAEREQQLEDWNRE